MYGAKNRSTVGLGIKNKLCFVESKTLKINRLTHNDSNFSEVERMLDMHL